MCASLTLQSFKAYNCAKCIFSVVMRCHLSAVKHDTLIDVRTEAAESATHIMLPFLVLFVCAASEK